MFRFSKQNDDIIIREVSYSEFIEKGLPASLFLLLLLFLGLNEIKTDIFMIALSIGLLIFVIYKFCSVQLLTLKLNVNKRIVSIQKRSLIKNKFSVYRFSEIAGQFSVEWQKDNKGAVGYKLVMPIESGKIIDIAGPVSFGEIKYQNAADLLNHLVFNKPAEIPDSFTGICKL